MENTNMENCTALESNVAQAMEYVRQRYNGTDVKAILTECVETVIRNRYEYPDDPQVEECFDVFLSVLGFSRKEIKRIAERDFPEKVTIPVDVAVTRHYRTYVECYDGAYEEDIRRKAVEQIVENQDDVLTLDPDFEIEENDVGCMYVDFDGVQEA